MASGFDELRWLGEDAFDYLKLRWASLRLAAVDRLSCAASKALGVVLTSILITLALMFLMVALALWIGEELGSYSLGFLICGGVFLLAGVAIFFVGRRMLAGPMVRTFVDLFFTDND